MRTAGINCPMMNVQSSVRQRSVLRLIHSSTSRRGLLSEEELNGIQTQLKSSEATLVWPQKDSVGSRTTVSSKRALAIVMGWTSSRLKPVVKHAAPYTKLCIPALCVAPSVLQVWSTTLGSRLMRSLLQSLNNDLKEPVSLIMHTFSYAPGVLLPLTASDFESSERELTRKLNPLCVTFDSGPAEFSYAAGMAGARLAYSDSNLPSYVAAICAGITVNVLNGRRRRLEMQRVLRSALLEIPQLYLYSEADTVTPPSRVQKLMLDQQAMGREVLSHCWKDSEHVSHYRSDPETYEHYIHTLLKRCLII